MGIDRIAYRARKILWGLRHFSGLSLFIDHCMNFNEMIMDFPYRWDGLISKHNCDFIREPRFARAYALGKRTESWGKGRDVYWRAYVACWVADHVKRLDGDFVECGVNKGGLSRAVIDYIDFDSLNKTFYLLDTFDGLVDAYVMREEKAKGINSGPGYDAYRNVRVEDVKATFEGFNVKIIQGIVPETLPQVTAERVCYLSLDMNCTMPEIAAARHFWDRLVAGAVMVLDDYGWPLHDELKRGYDEFAAERGVSILSLPTGQGLIFKPTR